MLIVEKSQLSESDIRRLYIDKALEAKWDKNKIATEVSITDGRINLKGNFVTREKPKRADYILYLSDNNPIAVVGCRN